jgi:hypothetical protein
MRRSLLGTFLLTLALSAACAAGPEASGGIYGQVLAGPTCPVERPGEVCGPRPWVGRVRATSEEGRTYEEDTDDEGRYALDLPPGVYTVVAVTSGGPPTGIPQAIQVPAGQPMRVDLEVDTGIR